jgi:hypothetical protein
MNLVLLRRHAELLRAAPGDGAHVSVLLIVLLQHLPLGGVDLRNGVGDLEVENAGGALETLRVLGALVDLAAVGPLALEHGAGVMQAVGEDVDLGVRGGDQRAVEPDQVRALVEGHGHGIPSWRQGPTRQPQSPLLLRGSSPDMFSQPSHESALPEAVQEPQGTVRRYDPFA